MPSSIPYSGHVISSKAQQHEFERESHTSFFPVNNGHVDPPPPLPALPFFPHRHPTPPLSTRAHARTSTHPAPPSCSPQPGFFKQSAEDVNAYLSQPDFLSSLDRQPGVRRATLEVIHTNLVEKPISVEECIVWARLKFEELYHNSISQLLYNFPLDMATSSGAPFWSGPKRPPTPLNFDSSDGLHMAYITAAGIGRWSFMIRARPLPWPPSGVLTRSSCLRS